MDVFKTAIMVAGSGMRAQGERLKIISENLANANSTADSAGGDPYRRKTITFRDAFDRALQADLVRVREVGEDPGQFTLRFDPAHPAADQDGYVKLPNVDPLIETMDMREANRSYQANIQVIENAKSMFSQTVNLLR